MMPVNKTKQKCFSVLLKAVRSRLEAARSRPDVVRIGLRRPEPYNEPPHQTGKCPRIRLQFGDVNINIL